MRKCSAFVSVPFRISRSLALYFCGSGGRAELKTFQNSLSTFFPCVVPKENKQNRKKRRFPTVSELFASCRSWRTPAWPHKFCGQRQILWISSTVKALGTHSMPTVCWGMVPTQSVGSFVFGRWWQNVPHRSAINSLLCCIKTAFIFKYQLELMTSSLRSWLLYESWPNDLSRGPG